MTQAPPPPCPGGRSAGGRSPPHPSTARTTRPCPAGSPPAAVACSPRYFAFGGIGLVHCPSPSLGDCFLSPSEPPLPSPCVPMGAICSSRRRGRRRCGRRSGWRSAGPAAGVEVVTADCRFPRPEEYPEAVVDFVRRAVELPEATPVMAGGRTAVRKRRVVHSSTLDGLGLLSQTRVQSRRPSSRRGRRAGLLAGNRIAINGVGGG